MAFLPLEKIVAVRNQKGNRSKAQGTLAFPFQRSEPTHHTPPPTTTVLSNQHDPDATDCPERRTTYRQNMRAHTSIRASPYFLTSSNTIAADHQWRKRVNSEERVSP